MQKDIVDEINMAKAKAQAKGKAKAKAKAAAVNPAAITRLNVPKLVLVPLAAAVRPPPVLVAS